MRDRLIELIRTGAYKHEVTIENYVIPTSDYLADYLLANGVIVPPCKVGQTVYVISRYYTGSWEMYECSIDNITIYEKNTFLSMSSKGKFTFGEEVSQIGKTVFLTREEAEQALRKEDEGK